MVLVELLTLAPPYNGLCKDLAMCNIKSATPPKIQIENAPGCMQRIIKTVGECFQSDPNKRPAAEDLVISFFRLQCFKGS